MPFTLNGFGTIWYGRRDALPDGSYVTTEFVVFGFVPIVPTQSLRVQPAEKGTNLIVYQNQCFFVAPVPLNTRQVVNVYAAAAAIVSAFVGTIAIAVAIAG